MNDIPGANRRQSSIRWLAVLTWIALIAALSSRSGGTETWSIPHIDKLFHFAEYLVLGWLISSALAATPGGSKLALAGIALLLIAALGAGDEWYQSTVPRRDSSVWDWLADVLGGCSGIAARQLWQTRGQTEVVSQ